jgi:hypothetical protein
MTDDLSFTLRQVDQARTDLANIEIEIEGLHAHIARLRQDVWRAALVCMAGGAALTISGAFGLVALGFGHAT